MGLDPQRMGAQSAAPSGQAVARAAAVHLADRVAAEHAHPLDDQEPKLAGQLIAKDPAVRAQLLELLDQLGLTSQTRGQS